MTLLPFFTYYGGKYRSAPRYPLPLHGSIVEPFAGSAGYSLRYHERRITLVDADPVIAGLWAYLIRVAASEVRALPLVQDGDDVQGLAIPEEARWLIGFWLNKGSSAPCRTPSAWMRSGIRPNSYWGITIRERIASQVDKIRHWSVVCGSYDQMPNQRATWFVDPPYDGAGKHYRKNQIDYVHLGAWCMSRSGQMIVCENEGATWLPFEPFIVAKANESRTGGKTTREAIWHRSA
jgi:site-specific DNA-adenine methylase